MEKSKLKNSAKLNKPKRFLLITGLTVIFLIVVAILIYPFWPLIKYYISPPNPEAFLEETILPPIDNQEAVAETEEKSSVLKEIISNLLIIPKIGVRIPIVEGEDESALDRGAWRMPETSTPGQGSNTVITGHRFKYIPPHEKTFYLLDKLEQGDIFQIFWKGEEYRYKVVFSKIVTPDYLEALDPTPNPVVTLITCHPLFSVKQRLIVRGELINNP